MSRTFSTDSTEPLDWAAVKSQIRADDDTEQAFVETYVIPAARQMAETKTGAVLRASTFVETWDSVPSGFVSFPVAGVTSIESVSVDSSVLDSSEYSLAHIGRNDYIKFANSHDGTVSASFTAGVDLAQHPGVLQWMLLACAWAYSQRELLITGQTIAEMPESYVDSLLDSLRVSPKF